MLGKLGNLVLERDGEDRLDRSYEVLHRVKEECSILHTVK